MWQQPTASVQLVIKPLASDRKETATVNPDCVGLTRARRGPCGISFFLSAQTLATPCSHIVRMHLRCARTFSTDATYALCTCCRLCRGQIGSPATLRALYGCIFLLHRLHKRPAPERRRNKSFDAPVATHPGVHPAPESHWPSSLIMHAVHPLTRRREAHCQIPLQSSRPDALPVFVFPPPFLLPLSLRSCV